MLRVAAAILLLHVSVCAAQSELDASREFVKAQLAKSGAPSIAVVVVKDGRTIWQEGFGFADREKQIAATPDTPYAVASVTKSMTAVALTLLQQRKQLDLDRPVNDYLGDAKLTSPKWNAAEATVRRVAQHMAGLTTYFQYCIGCRYATDDLIRRYGTIFWEPGTRFDYSNLGYGILGDVIARVSGRSYADFMRDEVFVPLGMTHTSIGRPANGAPRYPKDHARVDEYIEATPGASSAYASVHDLATFGAYLAKTHVLDAQTVDAADGFRYGLGIWVKESQFGYRTLLAQGGAAGDSASLLIVPAENLVIAVATNSDALTLSDITDNIFESVLQRKIDGEWRGAIATPHGAIPLRLSFIAPGKAQAQLGDAAPVAFDVTAIHAEPANVLAAEHLVAGFHIHGKMRGEVEGLHELELMLIPRGDAMTGSVTAQSPDAGLSFWVELKRYIRSGTGMPSNSSVATIVNRNTSAQTARR